jgi:hypothetical protein
MNLIQIKQIDGLKSSLNSLAQSLYNLEQEVTGSFGLYDDFWDQHEWTKDYVLMKSPGDTVGGRKDMTFGVSEGHLYVDHSGVFGAISSSGPAVFTDSVGQIYFKNIQGEDVQLKGSIAPNHVSVTLPSATLSVEDYIIGVHTSSVLSEVTLPSATSVSAGKEYIIKDEDGAANVSNITVTGVNLETIDGALGATITGAWGYMSIYSNGSNWLTHASKGI